MQVKFEFVIYDEVNDKFEPDEKIYLLELNDEQVKTYDLLKDDDLHLYNWFQKSDFFLNWLREEVYPNSRDKKLAISVINNILFLRFYFFKVTSGDIHYEYFKKLFNILDESDWQDREDIGLEILEHLVVKREELIIDIKEQDLDHEDITEEV
jgi:hypothetical protein